MYNRIFPINGHFHTVLSIAASVVGKMSHYVTPFVVLNLGSEMVFVVAQRLQAQNVPLDRTNLGEKTAFNALHYARQRLPTETNPKLLILHIFNRNISEWVALRSIALNYSQLIAHTCSTDAFAELTSKRAFLEGRAMKIAPQG